MSITKFISPAWMAALAGIVSAAGAYGMAVALGNVKTFNVWLWVMYPALLVLVALIGYRNPHRAWRYGVFAVFASYLGALIVVPGVGNLLPFELLLHGALAVPAAIVGQFAAGLKRAKPDQTA